MGKRKKQTQRAGLNGVSARELWKLRHAFIACDFSNIQWWGSSTAKADDFVAVRAKRTQCLAGPVGLKPWMEPTQRRRRLLASLSSQCCKASSLHPRLEMGRLQWDAILNTMVSAGERLHPSL